MYKLKLVAFYFFSCVFVWAFSGCQEDVLPSHQAKSRTHSNNVDQVSEGMDELIAPNGQTAPYPTIIKKTFIPSNPLFANMKSLTWRITWPTYPANMDTDKIPTVFRTSNGALNSFHYLNNTSPQNTLIADFSLHHNNKLEAAVMMWEELDHRDLSMEDVRFYKTTHSANIIEGWVKERPQLFEINWKSTPDMEAAYQAGDIFLFKLSNKKQYGGIRIVSMNPRVIEVYLAVKNI